MSSYERRLLRKEINLKLYYMSNKEAQERDFINSSQMITERQHMYMIIEKHFREEDNRKTKRKQLPFHIESTSLPHISVARINRLFSLTKKITKNTEELDKIMKVHSYRTATPYYTNPDLTAERGNVMNYSQHVGTLLHTPRYIEFLKNLNGSNSSENQQISKNDSYKSPDSNSSRSIKSESKNITGHSKSTILPWDSVTSLNLSSSKSSLINDKAISSGSSLVKSPSNKSLKNIDCKKSESIGSSNKSENSCLQRKYDDKFESRNLSKAVTHDDSSLIDDDNKNTNLFDSTNEKIFSSKSSTVSVDSSKFKENENTKLNINKKFSSSKNSNEHILNLSDNQNEDYYEEEIIHESRNENISCEEKNETSINNFQVHETESPEFDKTSNNNFIVEKNNAYLKSDMEDLKSEKSFKDTLIDGEKTSINSFSLYETKSPGFDYTLDDNLEKEKNSIYLESDIENLNGEFYDEIEDFSESFRILFRNSIPDISRNDLIALKQLVNEYKGNIKKNTDEQINSNRIDENNESFQNLSRSSIGSSSNDITVQNTVKNTEETDQEPISNEDNDDNINASISENSESDLDVKKAVKKKNSINENEETKEKEHKIQEKDLNDDYSNLDNRVLDNFQSLFRNSIDIINEKDLKKINELLEHHEKEFIGN